jgi:hypothetical protein
LPFPLVTDPAAPPLRPQRHVPNSIATVHYAMVLDRPEAAAMPVLRAQTSTKHATQFMTQ